MVLSAAPGQRGNRGQDPYCFLLNLKGDSHAPPPLTVNIETGMERTRTGKFCHLQTVVQTEAPAAVQYTPRRCGVGASFSVLKGGAELPEGGPAPGGQVLPGCVTPSPRGATLLSGLAGLLPTLSGPFGDHPKLAE